MQSIIHEKEQKDKERKYYINTFGNDQQVRKHGIKKSLQKQNVES